eukprot:496806-Rhodomonas_salina.1
MSRCMRYAMPGTDIGHATTRRWEGTSRLGDRGREGGRKRKRRGNKGGAETGQVPSYTRRC